jgi:hypothetical protein
VTTERAHGESDSSDGDWYGVRCIYRWDRGGCYEERVTLWRAGSIDEAIELAEAEAEAYAQGLEDYPRTYVGLAQAYQLSDVPGHGAEVFSLLRDSELDADAYLSSFFDTGREHEQRVLDPSDDPSE